VAFFLWEVEVVFGHGWIRVMDGFGRIQFGGYKGYELIIKRFDRMRG
jgi:hypothetical protein